MPLEKTVVSAMRDYTRKMFMCHLMKVVIKTYLKSHVTTFTEIKTLPYRRGFMTGRMELLLQVP